MTHRTLTFPLALMVVAAVAASVGCASQNGRASTRADRANVLMVLTSADTVGEADDLTGFWLEEFYTPYRIFRDAGLAVDVASIRGGGAPIDPRSLERAPDLAERYRRDLDAVAAVNGTTPIRSVDASRYDAVFLVGGHGTMTDFTRNADLAEVVGEVHARGGVVAAVCHGPAGLLPVRLPSGRPLVAGRRIAAFTNAEEQAVELADKVPYSLEDELRQQGADLVAADPFQPNAVRDGSLITGQNPASSAEAAQLVIEALRERRSRSG